MQKEGRKRYPLWKGVRPVLTARQRKGSLVPVNHSEMLPSSVDVSELQGALGLVLWLGKKWETIQLLPLGPSCPSAEGQKDGKIKFGPKLRCYC